jgi:hypothetical protein
VHCCVKDELKLSPHRRTHRPRVTTGSANVGVKPGVTPGLCVLRCGHCTAKRKELKWLVSVKIFDTSHKSPLRMRNGRGAQTNGGVYRTVQYFKVRQKVKYVKELDQQPE